MSSLNIYCNINTLSSLPKIRYNQKKNYILEAHSSWLAHHIWMGYKNLSVSRYACVLWNIISFMQSLWPVFFIRPSSYFFSSIWRAFFWKYIKKMAMSRMINSQKIFNGARFFYFLPSLSRPWPPTSCLCSWEWFPKGWMWRCWWGFGMPSVDIFPLSMT